MTISYNLNAAIAIRNHSGPLFPVSYQNLWEVLNLHGVVPTSIATENSAHNMLELLTNGTIHLRGHHPWCYDSYRII